MPVLTSQHHPQRLLSGFTIVDEIAAVLLPRSCRRAAVRLAISSSRAVT